MFNIFKISIFSSVLCNIIFFIMYLFGFMEKINYLLSFFLFATTMFLVEMFIVKYKKTRN